MCQASSVLRLTGNYWLTTKTETANFQDVKFHKYESKGSQKLLDFIIRKMFIRKQYPVIDQKL